MYVNIYVCTVHKNICLEGSRRGHFLGLGARPVCSAAPLIALWTHPWNFGFFSAPFSGFICFSFLLDFSLGFDGKILFFPASMCFREKYSCASWKKKTQHMLPGMCFSKKGKVQLCFREHNLCFHNCAS